MGKELFVFLFRVFRFGLQSLLSLTASMLLWLLISKHVHVDDFLFLLLVVVVVVVGAGTGNHHRAAFRAGFRRRPRLGRRMRLWRGFAAPLWSLLQDVVVV